MAFHGVQVLYESITPPSVRTVDASTIFVVGTAPNADVDGKFGYTPKGQSNNAIRYNHPFLLTQRTDAPEAALGEGGTLPKALDSIFAQGNFKVVMVIVKEGEARAAKAAYDFDVETYEATITSTPPTGKVWHFDAASRQLRFYNLAAEDVAALSGLRIGDQITASASGGAILTTWTIELIDTVDGILRVAPGAATATFTDATAYDLQILGTAADDGSAQTRANAIGDQSELTGIYAAHAATSVLGRNALPRLLCAPGMDTGSRPGGAANPLAAAMVTVAENIKAIAFIDGPNTTHEAAIEYIGDFDSPRAVVIDPAVLISDGTDIIEFAASGFAAGTAARNDYDQGWWTSFSNKTMRGILGTARPIDAGHPASRAQLLLDNKIWTIVNDVGGFQFWGTDTPAQTEPDYSFPNIQRTADILGDSIQRAHRWAVAKGITKNYLSAVSQSVNDFIRTLVARGALSGGLCYPDPALNTPANIALGKAYFNVEWTGVYPANQITFKMQLTTKYLESLAA